MPVMSVLGHLSVLLRTLAAVHERTALVAVRYPPSSRCHSSHVPPGAFHRMRARSERGFQCGRRARGEQLYPPCWGRCHSIG